MLPDAPSLPDAVATARAHVACTVATGCGRDAHAPMPRLHALILADRLNRDYEELKKQRSQLDFEDLITRTADLLTKERRRSWIHYKLDQGIDHILVDEAQDTSPIQWSVIQSLAEDFFSGESAGRVVRTLCRSATKSSRSIPSRAPGPERFSEESERTRRRVSRSGQAFRPCAATVVPLHRRRACRGRPHLFRRRKTRGA